MHETPFKSTKRNTQDIFFSKSYKYICHPYLEIIFPSHVKLVYHKYPIDHNLKIDVKQESQICL